MGIKVGRKMWKEILDIIKEVPPPPIYPEFSSDTGNKMRLSNPDIYGNVYSSEDGKLWFGIMCWVEDSNWWARRNAGIPTRYYMSYPRKGSKKDIEWLGEYIQAFTLETLKENQRKLEWQYHSIGMINWP